MIQNVAIVFSLLNNSNELKLELSNNIYSHRRKKAGKTHKPIAITGIISLSTQAGRPSKSAFILSVVGIEKDECCRDQEKQCSNVENWSC